MAISTRESAIVHMVDKVVTKLDLLDKETFFYYLESGHGHLSDLKRELGDRNL